MVHASHFKRTGWRGNHTLMTIHESHCVFNIPFRSQKPEPQWIISKSCKIYIQRPVGMIMDDHDQPMSFLGSYPGPIASPLARPRSTPAFHCMLLLLQRQWSLDGVLLLHSLTCLKNVWPLCLKSKVLALLSKMRLCRSRGCRNLVAFQQLQQSFSNSNALGPISWRKTKPLCISR